VTFPSRRARWTRDVLIERLLGGADSFWAKKYLSLREILACRRGTRCFTHDETGGQEPWVRETDQAVSDVKGSMENQYDPS
jgi:hypothetical protein